MVIAKITGFIYHENVDEHTVAYAKKAAACVAMTEQSIDVNFKMAVADTLEKATAVLTNQVKDRLDRGGLNAKDFSITGSWDTVEDGMVWPRLGRNFGLGGIKAG